MKTTIGILLFCGFMATPLFSDVERGREPIPSRPEQAPLPWFTGPLLAPSAHIIPPGHWNIEPYIFATTTYGTYDASWGRERETHFHTCNVQIPIQYGPGDPIDLQVTPQFSWNQTRGASEWVVNDLPFGVDIQLVTDKKGEWWPAVKISLKASAPIGKYQKLNSHKRGTDVGGTGTWSENAGIAFSRLFELCDEKYFGARLYFGYTFPNSLHVKGLNAYGGGKGTEGRVHPGNSFVSIVGLEYTLTKHWVLACDFQYLHNNKTRFKGKTIQSVGGPSSEQWSLAPAIEYNWSPNLGLIAGVWFSAAGRNAPDFASGVVALNIYR